MCFVPLDLDLVVVELGVQVEFFLLELLCEALILDQLLLEILTVLLIDLHLHLNLAQSLRLTQDFIQNWHLWPQFGPAEFSLHLAGQVELF